MQDTNKEKYELIEFVIDKFLEVNPNDSEIWVLRGNIQKIFKKYIQALESYDKAINIESKNIEAYFQEFIIYDKCGNFGRALRALEKVIELKSSYLIEFKKNESFNKTFSTSQQTKEQHSLYEEPNQKTADYWYTKSVDLFSIGKPEEALNTINESLYLNSECAEAWYKKSEILHYLGQPTEALVSVEKSLKLNPKCPRSWCKKSSILNDLGRTDEALQTVELSIVRDPSFAEAWCQKGIILFYKEQYHDALKSIEEALRINPDYTLAISFKKRILVYITQQQKETTFRAEPIKVDKPKESINVDINKEKSKNIESLICIDEYERSAEKDESMKNSSKLFLKEADDKNYYCIICGKKLDQYGNICSETCEEIYKTFVYDSSLRISRFIAIKGFCNSCGNPLVLRRNLHNKIENRHPECYSENSIYSKSQREKHKSNQKQSIFCIICGKILNQRKGFTCSNECLNIYVKFRTSNECSFKGFCNFCGKPHELIKDQEKQLVMHRHQECYTRTCSSKQTFQDKISKMEDHEIVELPKYEEKREINTNSENKKRSYCIICGKEMGNGEKLCSEKCVETYYNFHRSSSTSIKGFCNFCGKIISIVKNNCKGELIMHENCYHEKNNNFKVLSKSRKK